MTITYRRPNHDEYVPMMRTFIDLMNQRGGDDEEMEKERARSGIEMERSWLAYDGGEIVGTTTAHTFEMTVPGGDFAPMAGLTLVSVVPTHRRRGIMVELMRRFFDEAADRGDVFAGLFASEASIYGRFGYGVATRFARVTIDRDRAKGLDHMSDDGRIRWMRMEKAVDDGSLPAIYERTRAGRPGELVRTEQMLEMFHRRFSRTPDKKPAWVAIHETNDGEPDGYVIYRIESKWIDHTAQNEVHIVELVGAGSVRVALWRFLLDLDLVRTVSDDNARLDEPVADLLADPRQLRCIGVYDQLWLRVIDVQAALARRTYHVSGRLAIAVEDAFLPDQSGTYALEVADDGKVSCELIEADPDLVITARGLATVYLGDRGWSSLRESGLVRERSPGAAAQADAMFSVFPSPQCLSIF